jgi:peroxiredoxin
MQVGLDNVTSAICKSQLQFRQTNIYQLLYLTSSTYFQSAAAVGGRNSNATPAQSPARCTQDMTRLNFISVALLISLYSAGQIKKQRVVVDNNKKFLYSDTTGVTQSYIAYFGNTFPVPDLTTIDDKTINQADLKGKTVIYNFWFVSCRPCVAEIPALNRLVKKHRSDTTLFIAVTFDNEDRIKEFLQKHEFTFQIVSLRQTEIDTIKKISFYPFTAIVTKEGKLSFALFSRPIGKNPEEEIFNLLDKQIEKALLQ